MYVAGLHTTPPSSRELNTRAVELISLLQTWTDLLGDAHANLYRTTKDDGSPVHSWDCDHYFYHSQGYAHVMYHMMQAIEREYKGQLKDDPVLKTLFDDAVDALGKAARDEAVNCAERVAGWAVRESSAQSRRLHHRGAPEDVLAARRAGTLPGVVALLLKPGKRFLAHLKIASLPESRARWADPHALASRS